MMSVDEQQETAQAVSEAPEDGTADLSEERDKPAQPSLWQRLLRRFSARDDAESREERLNALNDAIHRFPEAAVNYLLRGEFYLQTRQRHLARADFEQALKFALADLENERWGIAAQSIADRARQHLQDFPAED